MTIGGRFLPKSVNLRLTALFDHLREASRFDFQEFHWGSPGPARTLRLRSGQAGRTLPIKKSARELRQGGSDYRCCIPALAGFVSPQSIAPDGDQIFSQESQRATRNSETSIRKSPHCARPRLNPLSRKPNCSQPNGRFAFTRATSVVSTSAALPSRRLRFALFAANK